MPETKASTSTHERLIWRVAEVAKIVDETPRVKSLVLDVPGWPGHRPGQHVDVRLTAEDGYQAQRSYSVASEPENARLMLTVELIEEGEVSPYLTSDVRPGDKFELRGPIGGYFVWTVAIGGPLFLVAGGSGIAPLMARHARLSLSVYSIGGEIKSRQSLFATSRSSWVLEISARPKVSSTGIECNLSLLCSYFAPLSAVRQLPTRPVKQKPPSRGLSVQPF